jgi:hypothetical protein
VALIGALGVFAVAAATVFAAKPPPGPPLKVAVSPTSAVAGSTGNVFTIKVTATATAAGQLSLVVPAGWSAPQSVNSTLPGYVSILKQTCASAGPFPASIGGSGPWTVLVNFSCASNKNFSIKYGGAVASSRVTAPTAAGSYEFTGQAAIPSGSPFQRLATQPVVTVTPAPVHLVVSGLPATSAAGVANSFTVTARDSSNNVVASYAGTVHFSSTDPSATLPANYAFTAADAGSHTFTPGATFVSLGSRALTATDTANASITGSQTTTVGPGPATRLVVSGLASPSTAGATQSLTVTAQDQFNNIATGYVGTVHLTSTDGRASVPADYTFTAADAGAHTFSGVVLDTAGQQTVTATDTVTSTITGSQTVQVNPGSPSTLRLSCPSQPKGACPAGAGNAAGVIVRVLDGVGNLVTGYAGTVHFTTSDPGTGVVLPTDYTFTAADGGTHSFSVTFVTAGLQTVTASDTSNLSLTGSLKFNVSGTQATHLVVSGLADPSAAGAAQDVTVTAADAADNVATGYTGTVHFTSTDPNATLPGDYTFTAADNGSHTFTSGVTLKTAGSRSVTATDTVNAAITGSQGATVSPGALSSLVVSPGSATIEGPPLPPAAPFVNRTETGGYPQTVALSAEGFDAFGNDLGDQTAAASWGFASGGAGTCTSVPPFEVCGNAAIEGDLEVDATIGPVTGTATLTTGHGTLSYTCQGEHYDVDSDILGNGCEHTQPLPDHEQGSALSLGAQSCNDGTTTSFSGVLYSDTRVHANPSVTNFDPNVGTAPEWYTVHATGGLFCIDDYDVQITISGSADPTNYMLILFTNKGTFPAPIHADGTAELIGGSGSYSDGSDIYFEIVKTGHVPFHEAIGYSVSFHL